MRLVIDATPKDIKNLKYVQKRGKKLGEENLTLGNVASEAFEFYFQIYFLLENGYKIAIEDRNGKMKYFSLDDGKPTQDEEE